MASEVGNQSQFFRDLYRLASADLDSGEKIEAAVDIGRQRLDLDYGVLSYTGDGQYEIVETNITTGKYAPGSVTDLDTTWCRHVVSERELLAFADAETTTFRDDVAREATGLQCYIGTPVIVDGEIYGSLCYSSDGPRTVEFDESEEQFVTLLGQWVSREIERTKHHHELRRQNDRLDEFAGVVAHDLRNPLAGAMGYTEIALERTTGEVNDFLQQVDQSLNRMESLIGECLVMAKQGTDVGDREQLELAAVAEAAWNTVTTDGAEITIEAESTIHADEGRLQRLFENLFRNVVEHCQPGVSVTVADRESGFSVADDGPGLPSKVQAALESNDPDNIKELGLGLLIVQRIVAGHGWDLAVAASDDGTTFEISGVNRAPPIHQVSDES